MHYFEVKQILLQSFCQAITFYLLLKSEGQPVRDHPVVSRLVELGSLLDKVVVFHFLVNLYFSFWIFLKLVTGNFVTFFPILIDKRNG